MEKPILTELANEYAHKWNLRDVTPLGEPRLTSSVYMAQHQGAPAVLKVLTDLGRTDEAAGAVALQAWGGQGAVHLLRSDDGAHLLEYAGSESLTQMVHRGDDEQATRIIADVMKALHVAGMGQKPEGLQPLRIWFRELFEIAAAQGGIYARAAAVAEELLAHPLDAVILHGDLHHENVLRGPRGWLAIDPKGLYGERTYDAVNTILNPHGVDALVESEARILATSGLLADALHVDRARLLRFTFAYACLSAAWWIKDFEAPHALKMAGIIEPLLAP